MPKNWERRLVELAAIHGVSDFLLRGRLTKAESKVFYTILNKIGRPAARTTASTAARLGGTALGLAGRATGAAKYVALRHPVFTAGALAMYAYKNKDEIADLVEQGYEIVQPAAERVRESGALDPRVWAEARQDYMRENPEEFTTLPFTDFKVRTQPSAISRLVPLVKRKKSNYNKAVSAGMKAIKNSTSFGKKGVIKPAQSAFKTVVSVGKAIKAKRKRPKKGIRSKVYTAMKRFYK